MMKQSVTEQVAPRRPSAASIDGTPMAMARERRMSTPVTRHTAASGGTRSSDATCVRATTNMTGNERLSAKTRQTYASSSGPVGWKLSSTLGAGTPGAWRKPPTPQLAYARSVSRNVASVTPRAICRACLAAWRPPCGCAPPTACSCSASSAGRYTACVEKQ